MAPFTASQWWSTVRSIAPTWAAMSWRGVSRMYRSSACLAAFALLPALLHGQGTAGELRLRVADQAGLPAPSSVEIVSQVNQVRQRFDTVSEGALVIKRLAFGTYQLPVEQPEFAPVSEM